MQDSKDKGANYFLQENAKHKRIEPGLSLSGSGDPKVTVVASAVAEQPAGRGLRANRQPRLPSALRYETTLSRRVESNRCQPTTIFRLEKRWRPKRPRVLDS